MRILTSVLAAALVAQGTPALSPQKQLIIGFFGFTGTREARAEQYMTPDYVQHNPRFLKMDAVTGARGNQAWVAAQAEAASRRIQLVALQGIPLRNPIIILQDGDLIHAVYRGMRPDPTAPGSTYEAYAFESFRVRGDKFSEHWDQVRLTRGWMESPPAPAPGQGGGQRGGGNAPAATPPVPQPSGTCTVTPDQTAANKKTALALFAKGNVTRNVRAKLASDFVDHTQKGLLVPRPPEPDAGSPRVVDHAVADCDYVSIVWKQVMRDPDEPSRNWDHFTFDAFRFRGAQIAEHWNDESR